MPAEDFAFMEPVERAAARNTGGERGFPYEKHFKQQACITSVCFLSLSPDGSTPGLGADALRKEQDLNSQA